MLFENHLGKDTDNYSLARWISDLNRDPRKLWQADRTNVKDFRAALDLFETVLDGYIIGYIAAKSGHADIHSFFRNLEQGDPTDVFQHIESFAELLSNNVYVSGMRKQALEVRDEEHENFVLFVQQGLMLRYLIPLFLAGTHGKEFHKRHAFWRQWDDYSLPHLLRNMVPGD